MAASALAAVHDSDLEGLVEALHKDAKAVAATADRVLEAVRRLDLGGVARMSGGVAERAPRLPPSSICEVNLDEEEAEKTVPELLKEISVPEVMLSRCEHGGRDLQSWVAPSRMVKDRDELAEGKVYHLAELWQTLYFTNKFEIDDLVEEDKQRQLRKLTKEVSQRRRVNSDIYTSSMRIGDDSESCLTARVCIDPNHSWKLVWDMVAMLLLLFDCASMPIMFGWDIDPTESAFLFGTLSASTMYWIMDIVMTFNTGVYAEGFVEMRRVAVMRVYVTSWLLLDLLLICTDVAMLIAALAETGAQLSGLRALRVLKVARLARFAKLRSKVAVLEKLLGSVRSRWMALVVSTFRQLFIIYVLVHFFGCFWFFIGRSSRESAKPSWLDLIDLEGTPLWQEYMMCMMYVLGHFTPAPGDPKIRPQNYHEYLFSTVISFASLLFMGSAVAGMTAAIQELGKLSASRRDLQYRLNIFLQAANLTPELADRVKQYALVSFRERSSSSLQGGVVALLNERLKTEVTVSRFNDVFGAHPMFAALSAKHPNSFRKVCEALGSSVYIEEDVVFYSSSIAQCMYILHHGEFKVVTMTTQGMAQSPTTFDPAVSTTTCLELFLGDDHRFIAEVCLYTSKFSHTCSLLSASQSDAYSLTLEDVANAVKNSPECIRVIYTYAAEFLKVLPHKDKLVLDTPIELLSKEFARTIYSNVDQASQRAKNLFVESGRKAAKADPVARHAEVVRFNHSLATGPWDEAELLEDLRRLFPELADGGLCSKAYEAGELAGCLASMVSTLCLLHDSYELFTAPQAEGKRLTRGTWEQWQRFVSWAGLGDDAVCGVLTLLTLRGLGKAQVLLSLSPRSAWSREEVVSYFIDTLGHTLPSYVMLPERIQLLLADTLSAWPDFNLPQLLQGENLPYHIGALRRFVQLHGEEFLKFFLFCQVCALSGLGSCGALGSSFLDETNSVNLLDAVAILQRLSGATPQAAYWGYMTVRSKRFGLPAETLEDVALIRLCCLTRRTEETVVAAQAAWQGLSRRCRQQLTEHLLADGIGEGAFLFVFLPLYFANAAENPSIGFSRALTMLLHVIRLMVEEGFKSSAGVTTVDLSDLAQTLKEVTTPKHWSLLPSCLSLQSNRNSLQLLASMKFKERCMMSTVHPLSAATHLEAVAGRLDAALTQLLEPVGSHRGGK